MLNLLHLMLPSSLAVEGMREGSCATSVKFREKDIPSLQYDDKRASAGHGSTKLHVWGLEVQKVSRSLPPVLVNQPYRVLAQYGTSRGKDRHYISLASLPIYPRSRF